MATLLSDMQFGAAGAFGAHGYAEALATEAVRLTSAPVRRPASPPQPVPQPWRGQAAASVVDWAEALEVAASPASSDATEQFLDCHSEPMSLRSSFEAESELLARGMQSRLPVPETLAAAAAAAAVVAPSTAHVHASAAAASGTAPAPNSNGTLAAGGISLQQERQRRLAAEAAAAALRQQLDDISAALFSFRSNQGRTASSTTSSADGQCSSSSGSASGPAAGAGANLAAEVAAALLAAGAQAQLAVEEAEAQRQRAEAAEAAAASAGNRASDAAYVARLVAGICVRAAVAADLESGFAAERASLERRLQQATRMGHAMLKHSKEAEPEPWKQQLLNTIVSVGCSILGAATAVLIIRRYQV